MANGVVIPAKAVIWGAAKKAPPVIKSVGAPTTVFRETEFDAPIVIGGDTDDDEAGSPPDTSLTTTEEAIASMGEGSILDTIAQKEGAARKKVEDAQKQAEALKLKREKRLDWEASRGVIKMPKKPGDRITMGRDLAEFYGLADPYAEEYIGIRGTEKDPFPGGSMRSPGKVFAGKGLTPEKIKIGLANIERKLDVSDKPKDSREQGRPPPRATTAVLNNEINELQKKLAVFRSVVVRSGWGADVRRLHGDPRPKRYPGQLTWNTGDLAVKAYYPTRNSPGSQVPLKDRPEGEQIIHNTYRKVRVRLGERQEGVYELDIEGVVEDYNKLRAALMDRHEAKEAIRPRLRELEAAALNLRTSLKKGTDFQPPES